MKLANADKVKKWQSHLDAAGAFSDGIQAYCRNQGLQISTFYSWRKKLSGTARDPVKSDFLPVVVRAAKPARAPVQIDNDRLSNLPDARWVAEVITHLIRGLS